MGRAIDMEKDIDKLKAQVERIDSALAKVIDVVDSMQEKGQRTTHVDLVEDIKPKEIEEEQSISIDKEKAAKTAAQKKSAKSSKNKK